MEKPREFNSLGPDNSPNCQLSGLGPLTKSLSPEASSHKGFTRFRPGVKVRNDRGREQASQIHGLCATALEPCANQSRPDAPPELRHMQGNGPEKACRGIAPGRK